MSLIPGPWPQEPQIVYAFADSVARWVAVEKAAAKLLAKLDHVHDHPSYQSVWSIHQNIAGPYAGPKYEEELGALRKVLGR